MPITQNDMIDVIMAGLNFRIAYQKLRIELEILNKDLTEFLNKDQITKAQQRWAIFYGTSMFLPENAVRDEVLLLTKQEHYRKFYNENTRHKRQMQRKRAAKRAGIPLTDLRRDPTTNLTPPEISTSNTELAKLLEEIEANKPAQPTATEQDYTEYYRNLSNSPTPFDRTRTLDITDVNKPDSKPEGEDK